MERRPPATPEPPQTEEDIGDVVANFTPVPRPQISPTAFIAEPSSSPAAVSAQQLGDSRGSHNVQQWLRREAPVVSGRMTGNYRSPDFVYTPTPARSGVNHARLTRSSAPLGDDTFSGTPTDFYGSEQLFANRHPGFGGVPEYVHHHSPVHEQQEHMSSPQQMYPVFNPRNLGGTFSREQPLVQHEYHDVHGTSEAYEAVHTARMAPHRRSRLPSTIDPALTRHEVPSASHYTFPSQQVNSAAQIPRAHRNFGTNNIGNIPRELNSFAQNNSRQYDGGLNNVLMGTQSVAPIQHRNFNPFFPPFNNNIGHTPSGIQPAARNEYANEYANNNAGYSRLPGNASYAPGLPNDIVPASGSNVMGYRSAVRNAYVNSNVQYPQPRNPMNVLPPAQSVVQQHFNFDSQISRPMGNYYSDPQAGHLPNPPLFEQDEYSQQQMGQAMEYGDDTLAGLEEEDEDEETQPTPSKKARKSNKVLKSKNARKSDKVRKSTNGPLVDAPHAALQVPDCDLTASDIFCLFPKHYLRPALMERFVNNGWQAKDIADAMSYSRGVKVNHQMIYNGAMKAVRKRMKGARNPDANMRIASTDLPACARRERSNSQITLCSLAQGVRRWPEGRFLTPAMEAVKWCWDNQLTDYTLDQLPALILQRGYQMPAQTNGMNLDQEYRAWIKFHFAKNHQPCDECASKAKPGSG